MSDIFDQLLSAKWKDVEFPVTKMHMSVAHDLVEHKYWRRDGARVESTGLAPFRFSFSAPLLNGISPGNNERWAALYPNQMRILLAAFQEKETGDLQHPEFGIIPCKAERFDMDWDATRRGGVDAELTFVQTLTDADFEVLEDTPVQVVDIGAIELDSPTLKVDLKKLLEAAGLPLPPYLADDTISLSQFANKIKAITDYPTVVAHKAGGQIDELVYHVNRIQESVSQAKTSLTWPVTQNVERIKAAAHNLQQTIIAGSRKVKFFRVPEVTTLAGVVQQIPGATVGDIVKLNPTLSRSPKIPENTIVRYYA